MIFIIELSHKLPAFKKGKKVIKIIVIVSSIYIPTYDNIFIV